MTNEVMSMFLSRSLFRIVLDPRLLMGMCFAILVTLSSVVVYTYDNMRVVHYMSVSNHKIFCKMYYYLIE